MAVENRNTNLDLSKYKPGLIYDADGITLVGKYTDELSAYRAKRQWTEVLNSYFLLEKDRDYEMWVNSSIEDCSFALSCCFVSACGRYAFWRLINHQAPEAEQKLGGSVQNIPARRFLGSLRSEEDIDKKTSWVIEALNEQIEGNQETIGILQRIRKLFR